MWTDFQNSFTSDSHEKKDFHLTCSMLLHYLVKVEGYTIRSVCLSLVLSFMLSVCRVTFTEKVIYRFYWIWWLKLGVMIGPINRKSLLTFSGGPLPDTHSESLLHFPHSCEIGDFRRFNSISHTATGRFLRSTLTSLHFNLSKTVYRTQLNNISIHIFKKLPFQKSFWNHTWLSTQFMAPRPKTVWMSIVFDEMTDADKLMNP